MCILGIVKATTVQKVTYGTTATGRRRNRSSPEVGCAVPLRESPGASLSILSGGHLTILIAASQDVVEDENQHFAAAQRVLI
jgi:hypothetical protein